MSPDVVSSDMRTALRRLKLSPMLPTLPERLALARQRKIPHQDFLLLLLQDEVSRRDGISLSRQLVKARLDPAQTLEAWDSSAKVSVDWQLVNELASMRFVEANENVTIFGDVGVGKTFLSNAIGVAACRKGHSVLMTRADKLLKTLKQSRLDNSHEAELRRLLSVDLLVIDDFALDAMDQIESRDAYEVLIERHRAGSTILTSNRDPEEWRAAFADPIRAQAAVDRFANSAYDLVVEGESYRPRQKPGATAKRTAKGPIERAKPSVRGASGEAGESPGTANGGRGESSETPLSAGTDSPQPPARPQSSPSLDRVIRVAPENQRAGGRRARAAATK